MATTKEIRKSIDLVEGATDTRAFDDNGIVVETVDNEMREQWKNTFIKALVDIGYSEQIATRDFEKLLHKGPRPGSKLYKSMEKFMNIGRSEN